MFILKVLLLGLHIVGMAAGPPELRVTAGFRPHKHSLAKFIVSIRRSQQVKFFGDNHICAGQILWPHVVITAAHCVVDDNSRVLRASLLKVVAGGPRRLVIGKRHQIIGVSRIVVHPKFNLKLSRGDLALLKLKKNLQEDLRFVQRVELGSHPPQPEMQCVTYGWGKVINNGPMPDELIYANLTMFDRATCMKYSNVWNGLICAGDRSGRGIDTCQGDSGGPLLCNGTKLTGLVSFGFDCGVPFVPGFYTDVYHYRNWIIQNGGSVLGLNSQLSSLTFIFCFILVE